MLGNGGSVRGLYLLAAEDIFQQLTKRNDLEVMVSFFEIYCGKLYDLLNDKAILYARYPLSNLDKTTKTMSTSSVSPKIKYPAAMTSWNIFPMALQPELPPKTAQTTILPDPMQFCRYASKEKIKFMARYPSLIWQAVKELQIMLTNARNKPGSMEQKSIKVYSHSRNASELWIKIRITLPSEAVNSQWF